MAPNDFELTRRVIRQHAGCWVSAGLELADLHKSGLGDYRACLQLLGWRLRTSTTAPRHEDSQLPPALVLEARRAGITSISAGDGVLRVVSGNLVAEMSFVNQLPASFHTAKRFVAWLAWQLDDLATRAWAEASVGRLTKPAALHPALRISVEGLEGSGCWQYQPVEDQSELAKALFPFTDCASEQLSDLLVSPECSLAFVEGELSVVVDQDFLCSESGDATNESLEEVIARLKLGLLPLLDGQLASIQGARVGIGHGHGMRNARPTVLMAVPVSGVQPEMVRRAVETVLDFAFPT